MSENILDLALAAYLQKHPHASVERITGPDHRNVFVIYDAARLHYCF